MDTLDEDDDDDIGKEELNWYILATYIWLMIVIFVTYYNFLFNCGNISIGFFDLN